MLNENKSTQLQIRVSQSDKAAIQQAAKLSNMDMSTYVLNKVLPSQAQKFQALVNELVNSESPSFVLAEINTLLSHLTLVDLKITLLVTLPLGLSNYLSNYLAAMVEHICNQHEIEQLEWVKSIKPLEKPVFGSKLESLRLYLLTHSPASFRRRNIFIDTTIGGQV